jgi:DNA-binding NarL/FixJ family response regulator
LDDASERPVTAAQRELLRLVSVGYSNKEIAAAVGVSEPAVKKRLFSLMRRYAVPNRAALVRVAMNAGLVDTTER